jgi:hypothetical protein
MSARMSALVVSSWCSVDLQVGDVGNAAQATVPQKTVRQEYELPSLLASLT